jgi:hypothetical protein
LHLLREREREREIREKEKDNEWDMYEWVLERMNGSYALHDINGGGGQGESFERDASIGTSDCQITIRWPSPIQRRCLLFLTAVP